MKLQVLLLTAILASSIAVAQSGGGSSTYIANGTGINEAAVFGNHNFNTGGGGIAAGIVVTSRVSPFGFMSFTGSTTALNTADNAQVNGYVKKYGNTAFTFPVGSGTDLRELSIAAPSSATDAYAASWIAGHPKTTGDPSNGNAFHDTAVVTGPIKKVHPTGQWDWLAISGTGAGLTTTVSIPDVTGFSPLTYLRLVGWNGTSWVNLSGNNTAATGVTENSTLTGTMIAGIQAVAIGSIVNGFPDLFPVINIDDLNFVNDGDSREFIVNVFEILNNQTDSTALHRVRIAKLNNFTFTYNTASGVSNVAGGIPNNNGDWVFTETPTYILATYKPSKLIAGFGSSILGLTATRNPGTPVNTSQNITATIIGGSGAEIRVNNNLAVVTLNAQ